MRYRCFFALLLLVVALPLLAQQRVPPRESPPAVAAFSQVETHRLRIVNALDGAVQISADGGQSWRLVGRVTAPATKSLMGYLASGYAQPGTIAATAVHGLRIRVGDLMSAYPQLINILPREFAATPKLFGGHVSGESGIYTNIPTGTGIFRDLSPYVGNPVFLQTGDDALSSLPTNYAPRVNDIFVVVVKRPANPLREVVFQNRAGGTVTATFADGTRRGVTTVIQGVAGVGRFDGTSYTGVGALNTNHTGVITVGTAPVTTSKLLEGDGPERRGGFQITPAFHNSQSEEAGAPQVLIIGDPARKRVPELEGTPPLFDGHFDLSWNPNDPRHSWRAQIQRAGTGWLPMPTLVGNKPAALRGVTAVRLVRDDAGDARWRAGRIDQAARAYETLALAQARAGKIPIERGRISLDAPSADARAKYVAFYVDGAFKALTNARPFAFQWDTTDSPDGEYVVEARVQDENSVPLSVTRTRIWVDNARRLADSPLTLPSQSVGLSLSLTGERVRKEFVRSPSPP